MGWRVTHWSFGSAHVKLVTETVTQAMWLVIGNSPDGEEAKTWSEDLPTSVLPTEEKKNRAVLTQELVGPISTSISQNLTKIFWPFGALTNVPNILPSPYLRPYSLGGCYMLRKSQSSKARFLFQATSASVPGGAVLHSHVGTGGFLLAAPKLEGVCMSQLELSMDRGRQEKATGSFPGDRPSVFTRCYKQEETVILANIWCVLILVLLCYSIHVPINHTSTKNFSVVTLIGQEHQIHHQKGNLKVIFYNALCNLALP